MKDLNKLQQLSMFTAMQALNEAGRIAARTVSIGVTLSKGYSELYTLTGDFCLVISLKGQLLYVIDVDVEKAIYFVKRANELSAL